MNDNRPRDLDAETERLRARLAQFAGVEIARIELRAGEWWAVLASGREVTTAKLLHDGL